MDKKQQQGNVILIIIIIILVGGFFYLNKLILTPLIEKIQQGHLSQVKEMNEKTKKIIDQGFDFKIFSQESFLGLKEYLSLPLKIENQGNPEPFKQEETEGCTGLYCSP